MKVVIKGIVVDITSTGLILDKWGDYQMKQKKRKDISWLIILGELLKLTGLILVFLLEHQYIRIWCLIVFYTIGILASIEYHLECKEESDMKFISNMILTIMTSQNTEKKENGNSSRNEKDSK